MSNTEPICSHQSSEIGPLTIILPVVCIMAVGFSKYVGVLGAIALGIIMIALVIFWSLTTHKKISVYEDYIEVSHPKIKLNSKKIPTELITEIRFTVSSNPGITVFSKEGSLTSKTHFFGTFFFIDALRFWYSKGIPIKNIENDHETQLFISGQIDEFPMKNEE